ncbi:hypothetical protein DKX38_005079 [Salix brachista]|uniref:Uncharacterized protein n=1 Tax=Salix brachista TaxID=2182728 RepID=A0A5N5NBN9_9ROSI|nr:hypothetical protein DKX38_005079 [Salix brachista]
MEWYSENCIDDFEVPKDQEVCDRLPSPESWSKWCTDASESHEFSNQSLPMDSKLTEELKFNGEVLSNEVESFYNGEDQSSGSRTSRGFSDNSFPQTALSRDQSEYKLDDLAGIEQLDEIFLYKLIVVMAPIFVPPSFRGNILNLQRYISFLEDQPTNEDLNSPLCFSPEAECGMVSADNRLTDTILDLQSILNDGRGMGSSKHAKTHAFSPSASWEKDEVAASHFDPSNSDPKDWAPAESSAIQGLALLLSVLLPILVSWMKIGVYRRVRLNPQGWSLISCTHHRQVWTKHPSKQPQVRGIRLQPCSSSCILVNVSNPSKHDSSIGLVDEETSLQQSALHELEMVLAQLNDKTRICFRDGLYRLASYSRQHIVKRNQNGDLYMEKPCTSEDEEMRCGGKKTNEMETNSIDRAIANLMFNKMDLNVRDLHVSVSAGSKEGISRETKPQNCGLDQPEGRDLSSCPIFRDDAEVPILSHGYP